MSGFGLEFPFGAWAWALAAALAGAFLWHARRSRAGPALLALRAVGVVSLALAFLSPTVSYRAILAKRPRLAILLDQSHSMASKAARGSRLDAAVSWLLKNRSSIESRAEPSFYALAGRGRRLMGWEDLKSLKPSGAALNTADSLRDAAEDWRLSPPQRAWLLSDGNAERAGDLEAVLGALGVPVDALGVGPARRGRELAFTEIRTPDFAFLHGRFTVQVSLEASGLAGERARLRLLRAGPSGAWDLLDEKGLSVGEPYETVSASFTVTAGALGRERYRLEAAAAGDSASKPRSREFAVEVIRQKYRIMYLAGRPSPEYAYLREFLKSDPNRELVSFVILRNPENPALVPDYELSLIPFPAEEIFMKSLPQFDLFILENFSYARFRLPPSYLDNLRSFVAGGGALLVIGGENAFGLGGYRGTALEDLLPVTLAGEEPDFIPGLFPAKAVAPSHPLVRLYETPEASASAWESLPPLDGFARFHSVRPGSGVLAVHPREKTETGEPLPILALRNYGRGKVLLVSTDSTWRWRLGAGADYRIASFYPRFWSRAVEYLTGNLELSKVKFSPLPDRLPAREPAVFYLRVFDESFRAPGRGSAEVSVLWTAPDGKTRELLPAETEAGLFPVELTGLVPGSHRLKAVVRLKGRPWGEDQLAFSWEAAPPEAPMDRQWLKRVSELASGEMQELPSADGSRLLAKLPAVRPEAEILGRAEPWAASGWLFLTLACLLAEWGLRRWRGLP